jgi:hypothetical protein
MPRKAKAVQLPGTQIDALLALDNATRRAALQRLLLGATDTEQVGGTLAELLDADRPAVEAAIAAAIRANDQGVQADDGEV